VALSASLGFETDIAAKELFIVRTVVGETRKERRKKRILAAS
jgi:hypothetical protein